MLVAVAVFLYSAVQLILIFIQDKQTDDLYNSLYSDVIPSSSEQESDPMDAVFDFDRLSEINTEIKGDVYKRQVLQCVLLQRAVDKHTVDPAHPAA